jgi:hypothetical protein
MMDKKGALILGTYRDMRKFDYVYLNGILYVRQGLFDNDDIDDEEEIFKYNPT